eukprot:scaffold128_cov328-Pavlova_lutheri.AAC.63
MHRLAYSSIGPRSTSPRVAWDQPGFEPGLSSDRKGSVERVDSGSIRAWGDAHVIRSGNYTLDICVAQRASSASTGEEEGGSWLNFDPIGISRRGRSPGDRGGPVPGPSPW